MSGVYYSFFEAAPRESVLRRVVAAMASMASRRRESTTPDGFNAYAPRTRDHTLKQNAGGSPSTATT